MERFGDLIDGAVVAYPASEAEIDNAANYLRDRPHGISIVAGFPKKEPALAGDGASIEARELLRQHLAREPQCNRRHVRMLLGGGNSHYEQQSARIVATLESRGLPEA